MTALSLTIPIVPPSGNHYKKPRHFDGHLSFYHTTEAKAWFAAVATIARRRTVTGDEHAVEYRVYRGSGQRGDVDNYAKVILDALVRAGVLASDDSVTEIHGYKFRDRNNPRTEIWVRDITNGGNKA